MCDAPVSDVRAARDQMNIGGFPYPSLPLQDAPPRATSVFSQPPSVCSSSSFNGPFPGGVVSPQPPSSYYSGMTGPQHPFYNRVSVPFTVLFLVRRLIYMKIAAHLQGTASVDKFDHSIFFYLCPLPHCIENPPQ